MDKQLSITANLTIYDSTPISGKADPGDEWATFSLGADGTFSYSNSDLTFTRDALERFLAEGKVLLDILDLPDPEDEPAPPPPKKRGSRRTKGKGRTTS
jgi:hypothetical protein